MDDQGEKMSGNSKENFWNRHPIIKEFCRDQLPIIIGIFIIGVVVSYLDYGFLPGGDRPFPSAGVRVPIWHLLWLGF